MHFKWVLSGHSRLDPIFLPETNEPYQGRTNYNQFRVRTPRIKHVIPYDLCYNHLGETLL